jgi:hypothetical protein
MSQNGVRRLPRGGQLQFLQHTTVPRMSSGTLPDKLPNFFDQCFSDRSTHRFVDCCTHHFTHHYYHCSAYHFTYQRCHHRCHEESSRRD